jgi:Host cell surface-exposed lipoprotein
MALVKCEDCGHDVSTEAASCPNCGRPMIPAPAPPLPPQPANPNRSWFRRHPILTVILALIMVGVIGSAISNENSGSSGNTPSAAALIAPPASNMTVAQQQAVESAKSYMAMGGFSRAGLISQLSSSAGEGFTDAQAVYAANQVGL